MYKKGLTSKMFLLLNVHGKNCCICSLKNKKKENLIDRVKKKKSIVDYYIMFCKQRKKILLKFVAVKTI